MRAQDWFQTSGVERLRSAPNLRGQFSPRARVVVFGSFMGGYHVLSELLCGPLAERVHVVGVATDDPSQPFTNAKVRLWKYPHSIEDEFLVRRFAAAQGLPIFTGRVKSPDFRELLTTDWRPELCLMATFGQKIPKDLIDLPRFGFFNFHHSGATWPSYPGPDPIAAMQRDGRLEVFLTMHRVNEVIDDGELFARSVAVALPQQANAIQVHRITWPQMHNFIADSVTRILNDAGAPPGFSVSREASDERLAA
jgi:methionyl-tRNA formyltransferase